MERLIIKSNLERFILLDSVDFLNKDKISGTKYFTENIPLFCMTESMAQLGAMHLRYLLDFQHHVFFAKAKHLKFHTKNIIKGNYHFELKPEGHSDRAFAFYLTSRTPDGILAAEGVFLFSKLSYDSNFQRKRLKNHYERILSCLQKHSGNVC